MATRQFRAGVAGGMLAFEVEVTREVGRAIIDAMTLPDLTASLGSVHTMVVHPPSTTHRQSSPRELLAAGITPGLLRVSVGLEDVEDLQADFEVGLAAAVATTGTVAATATTATTSAADPDRATPALDAV